MKAGILESYEGKAHPLGATRQGQCWNFSVYAPDASQLWLCLYSLDTEELQHQVPFLGRTGDVWHVALSGLTEGQLYGLKAQGPNDQDEGYVFDANRLLIDPYAKALNRSLVWNEALYQSTSDALIPKAVLKPQDFDWQGVQKPNIAREKTVIYEAHVKGLTQLHPHIPPELRGRYLGVCHPVMLQHYKTLGITSLQLLPIASFMSEPRLEALGLVNYWGYNPINFFTPDTRYAETDSVAEFKTMVRTLHQHGFEVILDVVFNHTAEAEDYVLSYRGLANRQYYLFEAENERTQYRKPLNYTGCGNTLNVAQPACQRLVLDALRYFATEMQVDGFRFDLAVTLAREEPHFNAKATFLQVLAQDPVLSQVKLIAEPWDLGPDGYQLGQFPAQWSEINDKCRDSFRAFWRQDPHTRSEFATRLMGSRDVFKKHQKPAVCSLNFLTYHDGFTLHDAVSYIHKHNWQNAEDNRDGHSHNLTVNYGVEGPSDDLGVLAARFLHKRNLAATLFLSQGMIHWLAGDELSRTQQGNNNAYCQDNELSWLQWELTYHSQHFFNFVCQLAKLRQEFSCLQQLSLLDDEYRLHGAKHRVSWYNREGQLMQNHDWFETHEASLVVVIEQLPSQKELLLIFNPSAEALSVQLPEHCWGLRLDTKYSEGQAPQVIECEHYEQVAHSLSIWSGATA